MIGRTGFRAALMSMAAVAALSVGPANAGEIDELKAQIEALQKRLGQIEAAQEQAEMAAQEQAKMKAAEEPARPGYWKVPGTKTSFSIGGYAKLDTIYDIDEGLGDTFAVNNIDPNPDGKDGVFGVHARQSRIRFDSITDTSMGALTTRVETDFYGDSNVLRLRHAYGRLGPVLAGQNWSIFMDEDAAASTVDFDGPMGVAFARTPQLRFTQGLGSGLTGQIAIEQSPSAAVLNPTRTGDGTNYEDEAADIGPHSHPPRMDMFSTHEGLPTVLAALRYRGDWGALNLSGAVGQFEYADDKETAFGLHGGVRVRVTGGTQVLATANMTEGMSYITGNGAVAAEVGGRLELQRTYGGVAGIEHAWTDSVRSGLYFGWVEHNTDNGVSLADRAEQTKSLRSFHANIIWSPVPSMDVGLEFMHGRRKIEPVVNDADGAVDPTQETKGNASRVQLGLTYRL